MSNKKKYTSKQKKSFSPNVKHLGQVFTPDNIVQQMLALRKNKGSVLEPACGRGDFLKRLNEFTGIELDINLISDMSSVFTQKEIPKHTNRKNNKSYSKKAFNKKILIGDFFSYPVENKFDTIIGNPPYVRFQDIKPETKKLLSLKDFDQRTNLYLFFIAKCIEHLKKNGELIFITPRSFLKATSAKYLNQKFYQQGTFTHYFELGDDCVFKDYSPNCAIWRFQKGLSNRKLKTGQGFFNFHEGQIWFGPKESGILSDFFEVKVGAVSGADTIFTNEKKGNKDFVCSVTATTGKTRRMIYNQKDISLNPHKQQLLKRRIRSFNESNWWEWGRKYCDRSIPRLYVNCKTRNSKPFFTHQSTAYDGSVMALFPKNPSMDIKRAMDKLNKVNWSNLGFTCGGRLLFTQRSLEKAPVEFSI